MPSPPIERPKRALWTRHERQLPYAARPAHQAGYFRFALRFDLRAFFLFEVRRAAFFAAISLTVVLFFLLLAVIGMKQTPFYVSGGTTRIAENAKNMKMLA